MKVKLTLVIITCLYLFTRLYNLTILPIFFDEANYIFWAKQIAGTGEHWFISLAGGKPVPLIWCIAFFLKLLPENDYLLAGRLPSVIFGLVTLFGIYKLTQLLTASPKTALIASLLYVVAPFALFHDRMALYDSQLTAMLTCMLYFFFKTLKSYRLKDALGWGIFLGLAFQAKASALALAMLTPAILIFLNFRDGIRFNKIVPLLVLSLGVSQFIANINLVSSGFSDYIVKSLDYAPTGGISTAPLKGHFLSNLILSVQWFSDYLTWPFFLFTLFSLIYFCRKHPRFGFVFVVLGIIPTIVFSYLGRIFFPRYFLFMVPYLLIPAAALFVHIFQYRPVVGIVLTGLLLILPLRFNYLLLTAPARAPFPAIDHAQYITSTPSGYGLDTVFTVLEKLVAVGETTIFIESEYYGNLYSTTALHFYAHPNLKIIRVWPPGLAAAPLSSGYLLTQEQTVTPYASVVTGQRPGGRNPIYLFKLRD